MALRVVALWAPALVILGGGSSVCEAAGAFGDYDADEGCVSLLQVASTPHPAAAQLAAEPASLGLAAAAARAKAGVVAVQASASSREGSAASAVGALALPAAVGAALLCLLAALPAAESLAGSARYVAEFVGSFVLVFTAACCVLVGSSAWSALATASAFMVMVYATGPVSGGNLNPAVSFALGLTRNLEWKVVLGYWAAQLSAGFSAVALASTLVGGQESVSIAPVAPFDFFDAMWVEVLYTAMLCFVVLSCAASKRNNSPGDGNQFYALAIGFVVVAGGYAAGGISGACFNPAMSMGLDIRHLGFGWGIVYAIYQLVGASLAALLYTLVRPDEKMTEADLANYTPALATKCLGEFAGTFVLSATVLLNVITGSAATAFSAAAALMCMVYALGDVSGAHFNPAVTFACVARGALPKGHGWAYIAAQTAAGVCAAALGARIHSAALGALIHGALSFALQPRPGFSFEAAGAAELLFTTMLAYVVLATATAQKPQSQVTRQNFYFGLSIGSCVTAGGFAIGAVSGGELNPAVGAALYALGRLSPGAGPAAPVSVLLGFAALQCIGGLLAAAIFRVTHAREFGSGTSTEIAALACEFFGSFVLVLTAGCCVATGLGTWTTTAIASALAAMVYATGPVSGGNLNPAVSFALGLTGDLKWTKVVEYWAAQMLGGACAGATYSAMLAPRHVDLAPYAPYGWGSAMLAEAIYTCVLCFVVLNCAASKRNNPADDGNQFFGLAIGFVVVAGGTAVGAVSGACLNPAVALGADISHFGLRWGAPWAAAELLGGAVAVLLYRAVRPEERRAEGLDQLAAPPLLSRCLSEFLGAFVLVLTVGLNILNGSAFTAWSAGAALMCMIYALGDVSGGHFNPAVTLAVVAGGRGKCGARDGALYVASQLVAALVAGAVCATFRSAGPAEAGSIRLSPGAGYGLAAAGAAELFFTAVLAYVVLAVATARPPASQLTRQSFPFALAIGSCVTAGGFAAGAESGGELNPAVALGLAVNSPAASLGALLPLVLWELSGAVLAVVVFRLTHPQEYATSEKV